MSILIAYASRHGSTEGIAERIAASLVGAGLDAEARPAKDVRDPAAYDAYVVGSAVGARDHHVFFGAFHQSKPVGLGEQFVMRIPAARNAFPEGDFRDWDEIDAWTAGIARELGGWAAVPPAPGD